MIKMHNRYIPLLLKPKKKSNVSYPDPDPEIIIILLKVIKMLLKEKEVREQGKQDQEAKSNIKSEPKVIETF